MEANAMSKLMLCYRQPTTHSTSITAGGEQAFKMAYNFVPGPALSAQK